VVGAGGTAGSAAYGAGTAYVIYGQHGGFSNIDLVDLTPSQGFAIHGDKLGDAAGLDVMKAGAAPTPRRCPAMRSTPRTTTSRSPWIPTSP
jgi:hypothetical protein